MTVKSYLIEIKAILPITLNDNEREEGQSAFEQIMEKAFFVIDNVDLNEMKFSLAVSAEINEELCDSFGQEE